MKYYTSIRNINDSRVMSIILKITFMKIIIVSIFATLTKIVFASQLWNELQKVPRSHSLFMCCSCTLRSFTLHVSSGSSHPSDLRCGWLIRRYPTMMFLITRRWSTKSWDERKTWSRWGRGTKGQRDCWSLVLVPRPCSSSRTVPSLGTWTWWKSHKPRRTSGEPRRVFSWRAGRPWLAWLLEQHPIGLGHVNVTHSYI